MRGLVTSMVIAVSGLFAVGSASAATLDFTRDHGVAQASSFHFTGSDGVQLLVTATAEYYGFPWDAEVHQDHDGIGVKNSCLDSNSQVDHFIAQDILWFSFNQPIIPLSATFTRVGRNHAYSSDNDQYAILIDSQIVMSGEIPNGNCSDTGIGTVTFTDAPALQYIGLTALDCNDDFKLASMTYRVPCTPAIPLPPAVWTGLSMLGTLGVIGSTKCLVRRLAYATVS